MASGQICVQAAVETTTETITVMAKVMARVIGVALKVLGASVATAYCQITCVIVR